MSSSLIVSTSAGCSPVGGNPSLSADGRFLLFSRRTEWEKPADFWMSWRDRGNRGWAEGWSQPVRVAAINDMGGGFAHLLPDERSLIFCSHTDGGPRGQQGIYLARLVRKDAPVETIKGLETEEVSQAQTETPTKSNTQTKESSELPRPPAPSLPERTLEE